MNTSPLASQIATLKPLVDAIKALSISEKCVFLEKKFNSYPVVNQQLTEMQRVILYSLIAANQQHLLGENIIPLLNSLATVEQFYDTIGGVLGYHLTLLELMDHSCSKEAELSYHVPPYFDLSKPCAQNKQAILDGISTLAQFAEVYPVGGAGDRLDLKDPYSAQPLPVAKLNFLGRTLLEGLVIDLQARERLHYILYGKQVTVPIVMMTSEEKQNISHILEICKNCVWFHRPRESFIFFSQPQVPVVSVKGLWANEGPLQPIFKPGGHGVIWKMLLDKGILDKLLSQGIHYLLLRQINNPLAGLDGNMLALAGFGVNEKKAFGFMACERLLNAAEGVDVLVEEKQEEGYGYSIRNIEYPQFAKMGLTDCPNYPANINLLYAHIETMKQEVKKNCTPGLLVNLNKEFPVVENGKSENVKGGRIESTMQNIADGLITFSKEDLRSFVLFNRRERVISVTKRSYVEGVDVKESPLSAFYDIINNFRDVLEKCSFKMPEKPTIEEYIKNGPSYRLFLHPALGPLWEIIEQKIRRGKLSKGAELHLECSEVDISDLEIEGSLIIEAKQVMGHIDEKGVLVYSEQCGKAELHDVKVQSLHITLEGNAEFFACGVKFENARTICVSSGHRLEIDEKGERLKAIEDPTWFWKMHVEEDKSILLDKYSKQ